MILSVFPFFLFFPPSFNGVLRSCGGSVGWTPAQPHPLVLWAITLKRNVRFAKRDGYCGAFRFCGAYLSAVMTLHILLWLSFFFLGTVGTHRFFAPSSFYKSRKLRCQLFSLLTIDQAIDYLLLRNYSWGHDKCIDNWIS
jgi:hypothetical protein